MMKPFRSLLMWLMLIAMPIQGMAQVSMFACHLGGGQANVAGEAHQGHASHGADHSMHAHNDHAKANTELPAKVVKSLHGCCNCAPSCAAVLVPVGFEHFNPIQQAAQPGVAPSQPPLSADSRRIDRPPKPLAI